MTPTISTTPLDLLIDDLNKALPGMLPPNASNPVLPTTPAGPPYTPMPPGPIVAGVDNTTLALLVGAGAAALGVIKLSTLVIAGLGYYALTAGGTKPLLSA
jgi:hypothetical protein